VNSLGHLARVGSVVDLAMLPFNLFGKLALEIESVVDIGETEFDPMAL
jgi:hypothetical protein